MLSDLYFNWLEDIAQTRKSLCLERVGYLLNNSKYWFLSINLPAISANRGDFCWIIDDAAIAVFRDAQV